MSPAPILIAGGTGLVGHALTQRLLSLGTPVRLLTRRTSSLHLPSHVQAFGWEALDQALEGAAGVVNLAGENIAQGRWSPERKQALRSSRLEATRALVEALGRAATPPPVLVNASAIGYYDGTAPDPLDESAPPADTFLGSLCRDWEAEAEAATAFGVRVVRLRIGLVLSREGGALPRMALPFRIGMGAPLGHGRQGMSWIHLADLVDLCLEALDDPALSGPVNATAPNPVSHRDFCRALARVLHRPCWPAPAFLTGPMLRLALGEMADALLLQGPYVRPEAALAVGFRHRFPDLPAALEDLLH